MFCAEQEGEAIDEGPISAATRARLADKKVWIHHRANAQIDGG
jgi:hypothetical protein